MKTKGKPWQFFVVAVLIVVFAFTAFLGISTQYGDTTKIWVKGAQDIRFGIDIRGGVDVTFMPADDYDATDEQMAAAESVIQQRLVNLNIRTTKCIRITIRTVSSFVSRGRKVRRISTPSPRSRRSAPLRCSHSAKVKKWTARASPQV